MRKKQCSSSEVCVAGICLVEKQNVGDTCDPLGDHDDCANVACGIAKFHKTATEIIYCPASK